MNRAFELLERLDAEHRLETEEYRELIELQSPETAEYAARLAVARRREYYGNAVYIRGLVEIGNVCRNDCLYCGIRRSNRECERYVLSDGQIFDCCAEGYALGFRTFVLQGGEGVMPVERICRIVSTLRKSYPDCAITLSLGEYPREDYRRMYDAANRAHYEKLHPSEMSFCDRMRCLRELKELGFQTGCGFMVGSPYQTAETLAEDLKFIESFRPEMCGVGPFLPQHDTPFRNFPAGTAEQTTYLLSLVRLIRPNILLPATTALGTVSPGGRERGIMAGANVVMPNLSPASEREKYALYDNKLSSGTESAQNLRALAEAMNRIGYEIVCSRGDIIK